MSVLRTNNITNRDGTSGPTIAGITTVSSTSHMFVPIGRTGQRYADGGENIIRDGLLLYLDAKYSYPGLDGVNSDIYNWYDMSSNGNNGELINGVGYSAVDGGSLVFDGSNDYVSFSAANSSYFTAQFWVKYSAFYADSAGHGIISNNTSTSNGFMIYQSTNAPYNKLQVFVCTPSIVSLSTNTELSTNTWYNFAVSYDGSNIRIYLNGVLDNSAAQTGSLTPNPGQLLIGRIGYGTSSFQGNVAQVSIYNRVLTASEVLQNYNAHKSRFGL